MDFIKDLFSSPTVIVMIVQGVFMVAMIVMQSKFATREEFEKLRVEHDTLQDKQERGEMRMAFMEKAIQQMPDESSLHNISNQITELKGELKAINARLSGFNDISDRMQNQVDRIDEFLKRRSV
ncbi:DUF2730 family protein [Micavibrio aeruginosavorus]|uniref:DUF2730 family protein n=1 Tax=Micavibrio aeruginosavorus TaxID=349221 RepID=UPI003F4AF592